jgi:hypothetical protein
MWKHPGSSSRKPLMPWPLFSADIHLELRFRYPGELILKEGASLGIHCFEAMGE